MKLNKKILIALTMLLIAVVVFSLIAKGNEKKGATGDNVQNSKSATKQMNNKQAGGNVSKTNGKGIAALDKAARENKYLFIMFYKNDDNQTREMRNTVKSWMSEYENKANFIMLNASDPAENQIVNKFQINRAPAPIILAVAPNSAVTGGFPNKITREQLSKCFVSEIIMKILKPIQSGKVVLVVFQNSKTKFNNESSNAAYAFADDKKVQGFVEIMIEDPEDNKNRDLLKQCRLDKKVSQSTIVFLVPPGRIAGVFPGKTTKNNLLATLASCSGGSCKPGSCPPIK
jgi:uncharacterized protein YxeA